jgi:hypothetical protein
MRRATGAPRGVPVLEVLPKAQIINPLFTSYPSTLWPTFHDLLKDTPRQLASGPLRDRGGDRNRIHGCHGARHHVAAAL